MRLFAPFSFVLPTRIEFGSGISERLPDVLRESGLRRPLVVTDPGYLTTSGFERIRACLDEAGIGYEIFSDIEPNPKDRNVSAGAEAVLSMKADCLVAIGGGSPMDCAKACSAVAAGAVLENAKDAAGRTSSNVLRFPAHYRDPQNIPGSPLPLITIPTTAGTGSEVTFSAVITDTVESYKYTIKSPRIAPMIALVDPVLTHSMPPSLTAATGMDALTHAVEAYTALAAEPIADACALAAVTHIARHLRRAVSDGTDSDAREGMMMGSLLAGLAFSHSDVAAVHCIAEALGGMYDLPHGLCNAIFLHPVMKFNLEYCTERYADIGRVWRQGAPGMGTDTISSSETYDLAEQAVATVKQLAREVGLPSFSDLKVPKSDYPAIARKSAANGSNPDNPRLMSEEEYLEILESLG
jgi:alcohol dehydrogenase